jgi:hypothetical protein
MVAKKGKKISTPRDPNAPHIGDWDRSKFGQRDFQTLLKDDLVKKDSEYIMLPGPETTPAPPVGFRVMFMAFILRGLSLVSPYP